MPEERRTCEHCERWQPRYFQVGSCTSVNMPNAKSWVTLTGADLLTVASFGCSSFIPKQPVDREMI